MVDWRIMTARETSVGRQPTGVRGRLERGLTRSLSPLRSPLATSIPPPLFPPKTSVPPRCRDLSSALSSARPSGVSSPHPTRLLLHRPPSDCSQPLSPVALSSPSGLTQQQRSLWLLHPRPLLLRSLPRRGPRLSLSGSSRLRRKPFGSSRRRVSTSRLSQRIRRR